MPPGRPLLRALNSAHPSRPGSDYQLWLSRQEKRPGWLDSVVYEIDGCANYVVDVLWDKGHLPGGDNVNNRNRMFYALSSVEAHLMRTFLAILRGKNTLLS